MAKMKKPENETDHETTIRKLKETIANAASRNDKVAFDRKMNNMVTLLAELQPIDDQISDLLAEKTPIIDKIQALRTQMVIDCVHPYTHQVEYEGFIICKFCNRKFVVRDKK